MEFVATCPKGFEKLLADELNALRIPQIRPLKGQVAFGGELEGAYRACMWSRLASRVHLVLARIDAHDSDALYEGLSHIAWQDHIALGKTFAIDAHGTNAQLRNTQFLALRSKDAIADALFSLRGARPVVDVAAPDVNVSVRLSGERAVVAIDLAGEPLFHRGYASRSTRELSSLRPDYAAALLASGAWWRCVRHGNPTLAALWPGQGSLVVEAVCEVLDRAPGLLRHRWGFEGWAGHDEAAWKAIQDDAEARAAKGASNACAVFATDTRRGSDAAVRQALRAAGVDFEPTFTSPANVVDAARKASDALVVADLSWIDGDSLATEAAVLSQVSAAAGLCVAALAMDDSLDAALCAAPAEKNEVFVGRDLASMRVYAANPSISAPAMVTVKGEQVPVLVPASDQFAARLAKVAKLRAKWARREDVSCYRVYDADLPDYAVAIELYEGSELAGSHFAGRWLQVSEYAAPKDVDPALARRRLMDVLTIAPRVLGVRPKDVNLRVRTRSRGGSQYSEEGSAAQGPGLYHDRRRDARPGRSAQRRPKLAPGAHLIDEGGLTFEVNFSSRLDCGIFLDHRDTRANIREMAKQTMGSKRFLNLFAYTGTATCYAADGGAKYTTTVDLSRPSLDWAQRNMERNGFVGSNHEYVQADVLSWVSEQRHTANRWDLIFCDVPTFSNSQRMRKASFDVQRDHGELLIGVSRLLTRNGTAVFSCNLRSFKPDLEKLERAGVVMEDVTAQTIPEDFARNPKIHHCYLVYRG